MNCSLLLEIYLWRFFEAWAEVEDLCFSASYFGALLINNYLKLNFPHEVFLDYVGNRKLDGHEVQLVVMNSQGIYKTYSSYTTLLLGIPGDYFNFTPSSRIAGQFPCCSPLLREASLWVKLFGVPAFYANLNFSPHIGCALSFTFCHLYLVESLKHKLKDSRFC